MFSTQWFKQHFKGDPWIWMVVIGLSLFGILAVYSATGTIAYKKMAGDTEAYLFRHTFLVVLGFLAMWGAHKMDYRRYDKWSKFLLIISLPLVGYTSFLAPKVNQASRWVTIPFIDKSFQPSDLAKLALIAVLASMLSKKQQSDDNDMEDFVRIMAWVLTIVGLIGYANLSTAIMLFLTCLLLMFVGRINMKYLASILVFGAVVGGLAVLFGQRGKTFIARIDRFVTGETVFQVEQSFIAIASGGITGKGPGNSYQKDFLPHPYSDFIYAIIIEEYGVAGGLVVMMLYLILLYRGILAASRSSNAFGGLLSAGLSFSLAIQAMVHMAACVGVIPVTGQPLPLVSMGGTSLLFTGLSFGIILSVSRGEITSKSSKKKIVNKNEPLRNIARTSV